MKQITILVDDKVGLLADISFILGKAHINIESIDVNVAAGKAIINLTIKDEKRAKQLLEANHYKVYEQDVVVVSLDDVPGELSKVSKTLADGGVNIESVHMVTRAGGKTVYTFKLDRRAIAEKLLSPYMNRE